MGGMNPFSGLPGGLSAAGLSNMTPSMISNLYMQGGLNRGQFPRMMEQVHFVVSCISWQSIAFYTRNMIIISTF